MGFRPGRSCNDALFTMGQLTSWSREYKRPLHACFVDLKKAYDSVHRHTLWFILRHQGVPAKLVDLLQDLHTGSTATVKAFGGESRPFEIKGGVRQGCNIAPLLFNIFLDFVTKQAASQFASTATGWKGGVSFRFNFQGEPFKVPVGELGTMELVALLLYADDMVLLAESAEELNHYVQVLDAVTQRWGLTINVRKTKTWRGSWAMPCTGTPAPTPGARIRGEALELVEDFKYLGSTLADSGGLDKELSRRWALATAKFAELQLIWCHKRMSLATKMCFYRAFITPTLLYGCESWPTTKAQEDKLNVFHMRCLRRILGVSIRHRLRNEHIVARCGIQQVPALISLARMRWAGHLIRMGNERLPKKILFGALAEGKRGRGKPRKRLADKYESDFHALAQANGFAAPSRPTRATTGKVSQSWWTPAADKLKWRACIDSAWPRKPPAP